MRRVTYVLALAAVSLAAAACNPPVAGDDDPATAPECQIKADAEKGPGFPFDLAMYEAQIVPLVTAKCGSAGCHAGTTAAPNATGFTVYADTVKGKCGYGQTFNSLSANINTTTPDQSPVVTALNGNDQAHPFKGAEAAAAAATLLDYATRAQANLGPPPPPPPTGSNPFDFAVYQTTIQPILDNSGGKGCTGSSCHELGIAGLKIIKNATGQDQIDTFNSVTLKANLAVDPAQTTLYQKATTLHGGGQSTVVSSNEAAAMLAWITAAKAIGGGGNTGTPTGCEPLSSFNVAVFRDDIQPVLFGDLGAAAGCALSACHGDKTRTGGALIISRDYTAEQNLASFACFVNLTNPVASPILTCPTNVFGPGGCPKPFHPGQDVFSGAQDPNYQRVLSYLYATKTVQSPLDFAFFARQINPIFNDTASVQNGVTNFTCAEATSCHGIQVVGQPAPNGSNFPIIANSSDKQSLGFNFSSAINFTNFLTPDGSSLFLYPTNEIANLANPFATGLPHPGGLDFDVNSVQAQAILKWAKGLRPDNQGFMLDWLVAGDYTANDINTLTVINETQLKPNIFDPDGAAQFNQGQWDGFFSPSRDVDLNVPFNRAQTAGRIVYAVAYIINTTGNDIQAQLNITSDDAVKVFVGNQAVLQVNSAQNGTAALANFPAFSSAQGATRVMIKLFQSANVNNLKFSVQLSDTFGNPLTDQTGELVVKLGPEGAI